MNLSKLAIDVRKLIPAVALSLFMLSCNNEDAANNSTNNTVTGNDTSTVPADAAVNNSVAQSGATTVAGDSGTVRTARRRGRVSTSITADDMNAKIEMDKKGYYNRTEVSPAFTGGQSGLEDYINSNLTYPQQAIDNDVEGTVRVQFAVDDKGNVSDVSTIGEKLGYGLEDEAVKVVSKMPKWKPGTVKGKSVKTWRTLPVIYKLEV